MLRHNELHNAADGEVLPYDLLTAARRRRAEMGDIPAPTDVQADALAALLRNSAK